MELNCFGLRPEDKKAAYENLFDMMLYSEGAITFSELKEMPSNVRNIFIERFNIWLKKRVKNGNKF